LCGVTECSTGSSGTSLWWRSTTAPSGSRTKPTLKNRPGNSGWRALACAITNTPHLRARRPELVGLGPGDVDRAVAREGLVVEVEHLVVEALQRALRDRDQAHGQIEPAQPRRRRHEVVEVLEVAADVLAAADAPHGGNEPDRLIRLNHVGPSCVPAAAAPRGESEGGLGVAYAT
jgi:hypothetical protein